MVNVDVSPSVVLGVGLIGAGVSLWQIRRVKPWISKDYDVVVSCVSLLVGGILIFQGWRLDPLLLFGQLMTTGAAVSFAIEALRLRSEAYESEEKAALQDVFKRKGPDGSSGNGSSFQLPPPDLQGGAPWAPEQQWQADYQQQQPDFFDYQQGQQQQAVASSSSFGYDQQQQQQEWDYGDGGGTYQPAEYDAPADDGGYYYGSSSGSSSSSGAPPAEVTFPTDYVEPMAGGGSSVQPSGAKPYDNMDDW